jgi:hypothetical protein
MGGILPTTAPFRAPFPGVADVTDVGEPILCQILEGAAFASRAKRKANKQKSRRKEIRKKRKE